VPPVPFPTELTFRTAVRAAVSVRPLYDEVLRVRAARHQTSDPAFASASQDCQETNQTDPAAVPVGVTVRASEPGRAHQVPRLVMPGATAANLQAKPTNLVEAGC